MDVICLPVTEGGWVGRGLTPVLASADKTVKVLDGQRLVYQVDTKLPTLPIIVEGAPGRSAHRAALVLQRWRLQQAESAFWLQEWPAGTARPGPRLLHVVPVVGDKIFCQFANE